MEIIFNDKTTIYKPLSATLNQYESERLMKEIFKNDNEAAIDLSYVQDCTVDFIEVLKKISMNTELSVFNIPSDIFVLFNVMNVDKIVKLYSCKTDFFDNSRRIINRQFKII